MILELSQLLQPDRARENRGVATGDTPLPKVTKNHTIIQIS